MNSDPEETIQEEPPLALRVRALQGVLFASSTERMMGTLVLCNFLMFFVRPQYSVTALAAIKFSLIMSVLVFIVWLPRHRKSWTPQTSAMLGFLVIEGLIGVLGKAYDPLIVNDFWHFHTWRDLAQQFFALCFPIVVFFSFGKPLRRLVNTSIFVGAYLGMYSLMHSGRGPGGFLGDENDICLTILLFLPLPLLLFSSIRGGFTKFALIIAAGTMLAGIVATSSRGGFVGFIVLAGFFFIKSHAKIATLIIGSIIALSAVFFVPQQYWSEMESITDTDTGTAQKRRDLWKIATRMWLDPANFVQGVGMNNTPYRLGDYEPDANKLPTGTSVAGRAVHSAFFQLIADLGLIGLLFLGAVTGLSYLGNRKVRIQAEKFDKQLKFLRAQFPSNAHQLSEAADEDTVEALQLIPTVRSELSYVIALSTALNTAWAGVLSAAMFISVLYYPPIWFLAAFSGATLMYWQKLQHSFEPIGKFIEGKIQQPVVS